MNMETRAAATWSVCATVNEPEHVLLHLVNHYLEAGASQVVLFLDGATGDCKKNLETFERVYCIPPDHNLPIHLPKGSSHEEKQRRNFRYFLNKICVTEWAGHIDADEYLTRIHYPHTIAEFFGALDSDVAVMRFLPMEAVYHSSSDVDAPFAQQYFRRPLSMGSPKPGLMAKVYGARASLMSRGVAGHPFGKSFLRRSEKFIRIDLHVAEPQGNARVLAEGQQCALVHYDAVSFSDWRRKFARRETGAVNMTGMNKPRLKQFEAFKECAGDVTQQTALFRSLYVLSDEQLRVLSARGLIVSRSDLIHVKPFNRCEEPTEMPAVRKEHTALWKRRLRETSPTMMSRMRQQLFGRECSEFSSSQRSLGRTSFVDARRIIQPRTIKQDRRLLFIAGLHRSGTTLLERHVGTRFETCVLKARVPEREGQFLQDVMPSEAVYGGPGLFAFFEHMHLKPPQSEAEAAKIRERILSCWEPWITGDTGMLLEKSPPNLVRIPFLRAVFPGSKFVIVARDPRASSVATQKWNSGPVVQHFLHWCAAYSAALSAFGDDCLVVRYEDMCEDLEGTMKLLGQFAGLSPRGKAARLPDRFVDVQNTNDKYLHKFGRLPHAIDDRLAFRPWEIFGYDISDAFDKAG